MTRPIRIRDLRLRVDSGAVGALTDHQLRRRIASQLPRELSGADADEVAARLVATLRGSGGRT